MKTVNVSTEQVPVWSLLKFGALSMTIAASMIVALVVCVFAAS